jgi:thiamine kinase-like enzyme
MTFGEWAPTERQPPRVEGILARGHANITILLAGTGGRWVLRLAPGTAPLGVCREREAAVHRLAAEAGLAPPLRYVEPHTGCLVTDYLPAAPKDDGAQDARSPELLPGAARNASRQRPIAPLAHLIRRIHDLVPVDDRDACYGPVLNSVEQLSRWRRSLAGADPLAALDTQSRAALDAAAARLEADPAEPVLCHNDLLAPNRLSQAGRLIAIDWEYACLGDAFFDLAVVASELEGVEIAALLRAYLRRPPSDGETQRLHDQQLVYRAIASCWYAGQDAAAAEVGASLAALQRHCRAGPARPHAPTSSGAH